MKSIKDIINSVNEHMCINTPKKLKFAEVYTNLPLVEEILNLLPIETWSNPNLRILDPCNGVGQFVSILIKKLMDGLKSWEVNEIKRYMHIVENMIYVCELQSINMDQYLRIFNPKCEFKLNYFTGSLLSNDFNLHMSNIWKIKSFDIIVANPPYQITTSDMRSATSIYHLFVEKSHHIGNMITMITPSKWFSNPSMRKYRENMINNYGLKVLTEKNNY